MASRREILAALALLVVPGAAAAATPAKPEKPAAPAKPAKPAKTAKTAKPAKPAKPAPAKKKPKPEPRLIITINKSSQKMTVALDGDTLHRWKVSTGARGYDTPSGNYRPFRMEREHYSKEWDDAPMPHSIFFTPRGHAVHGSYHVKSLGRRASHGCVRLHPDNAAKLFSLVSKTGMSNTRVIVRGGFFDGGQFSEMFEEEKKRFKKAGSFLNTLPD
jgi:lipoprotein-anchoring transpeptidase ErfK/SrfK